MTKVVVDASVAVKWFLPEVHSEAARRVLREDTAMLAPDLIWAEVGNVVWRKWRAGEVSADNARGILASFRRMPLRIASGDLLYDVASDVAHTLGRTFYDSLYLGLALHEGCPLVTADLRFYNALRDSRWGHHCLWVEDAR